MLLAADVGGTKSLVGLFRQAADRPEQRVIREYTTLDFDSLDEILTTFLDETGTSSVDGVCVGVAGPVSGLVARLTNVPWLADATPMAERFPGRPVLLLNDLEAMAYAVAVLEPEELSVLQEGVPVPSGNAALIAAGTGLGEALLHNVGGRFVPSASEGGHADFSARTPRELALVHELTRTHGRVDVERVVSGPGLVNLFRFTHGSGTLETACRVIGGDFDLAELPAIITRTALGPPMRAVRGGARDVRGSLRCGSGQPGAPIGGHGRRVHRRRHRAEDSPRARERPVHGGVSRQGSDDGSAAHDSGHRDSQPGRRFTRGRGPRRPELMRIKQRDGR